MDDLGYIKLARRIKSSWMVQGDHDALAVFIYLLTNVTHKHHKVVVDGQVIELLPGQVLGGRRRLAEACGLTEKQIRRVLELLENAEITAMQPANGRAKAVHVITFINWEFYQSEDTYRAKQPAKGRSIKGPNKGQTRATDNNGKNGKNVKEGDARKRAPTLDDFKIPAWINPDTWTKFVRHRNKSAKTRLTPDSIGVLIKQLGKARELGHDPNQMIEDAIANGWQGVVFERHRQPAKKNGNAPSTNGNDPWLQLTSKLGVVPRTQYPSFDDPKIFPALNKCGSWMELCDMPENKAKFDFRPKFLEAYKALQLAEHGS